MHSVLCSPAQIVDVLKVESQPATYLANVDVNGQFVSTVVSFNKGATWQPLAAPNNARLARRALHLSV